MRGWSGPSCVAKSSEPLDYGAKKRVPLNLNLLLKLSRFPRLHWTHMQLH